jgi:ABC-type transporter MlaC component
MSDPLILTIIILFMISLLVLFSRLNTSKSITRIKNSLLKTLEELKDHVESENEYERKDGIIRLDNLLGKALNYKYKNSLTCGENLKKAKKLFRKDMYQNLWDVHKLRNEVVHKDELVTLEEAKKSYHIYKLCITRILK